MKIRLSDSTGRPEPQFVVEAESDEDRLFLKMFIYSPLYSKDKLIFHLHGHSGGNVGISSFNFGWVVKQPLEISEELANLVEQQKEFREQQEKIIKEQDLVPSKKSPHVYVKKSPAPGKQTNVSENKTGQIPCPVCGKMFNEGNARKYCSRSCGQKVHNANYAIKHPEKFDKKKVTKQTGEVNPQPIDPSFPFQGDPEPIDTEFDGPF